MFHIALCEDNAAIRGQIRRYLDEYPGPETLVVREFPSGELLQGSLLSGQRYDLIILDIELERMSGIEVAAFLRTRLREMYTPLIYISAHREYAMELFKTTPIDFWSSRYSGLNCMPVFELRRSDIRHPGNFWTLWWKRSIAGWPAIPSGIWKASTSR